MVLTYDAYSETLENEKQKASKIAALEADMGLFREKEKDWYHMKQDLLKLKEVVEGQAEKYRREHPEDRSTN